MPHPQSPRRESSTDVAGGFCNFVPTKDLFRSQVPLQSQTPLSSFSPRQSMISTTMTSAFPEPAPSDKARRSSSLMALDDTITSQWTHHNNLSMSRLSQEAGYQVPPQCSPEHTGLYDHSQNGLPYAENYNIIYAPHNLGASCPRSYTNGLDLAGISSNMSMLEAYPPSVYQIEPPKSHDVMDLPDQGIPGQVLKLCDEYEHEYATGIKVEDYGGYGSPYSTDATHCSTPHDDSPLSPHNLKNEYGEEYPIDKEQPYAQLIYRALLEAPGKTMILRDIYNWFKENTDKAADKETKGWQNSIRHNLSMNGAFEKVDQPCEESKKGFMWRLTDKAVREGVKSTTRYRSKQPNKRGNRSQHPLPQRQASGAKGGQAARRSAKMRRSNRINEAYRSDSYTSRSVPTAYDPSFDLKTTNITMDNRHSQTPYVHSPYYGSEADYSMQDDFGSPLGPLDLDLLPARSYSASPLSHGCHDSAYILYQDASEPLFSNSPSPSADDPLTPTSPDIGWGPDMSGLPSGPCIFDEHTTPYREMMQ